MPAAVTLTLAETAGLLTPPMSERQLRQVVRALRIRPAGWHHPGSGRGHPVARYDAGLLFRLHAALVPFLQAEDERLTV